MVITSRNLAFLATLILVPCSLAYSHGASSPKGDGGDKNHYRIVTSDYPTTMLQLHQAGIDVAGVSLQDNEIDVVASPAELKTIEGFAVDLTVKRLNDNGADLDVEYFTFQKVESTLKEFAASHPELAQLEEIGKSVNDRPIWALKISDNVAERESDEPSILFNSMHHAREVMTVEVAIDTIQLLLENYDTDAQVRNWVDNNEIWVVPMLNVDGNDLVWRRDKMWRKNARGGYGVDLNRNYPHGWNSCNGSSGSKFSQTYRGPNPASEPETKALMGLVEKIKPVFNISYHSYSELVLYPYGCNGKRTANAEVVEGIGKELAEMLPSDRSSGHYTPGTAWETLYNADGGDIDWMHAAFGVIPYVIELNSTREGFQPSYDTWRQKTVEKLRPAWGHLLNRLQESGVRGQVLSAKVDVRPNTMQVQIESLDQPNQAVQIAQVAPDGSFHFVLPTGTYNLRASNGERTTMSQLVHVGSALERVELKF